MTFEYKGKTYLIDFTRQHRRITVVEMGTPKNRTSAYPYTTVKILEAAVGKKDPVVFREATVGCYHWEIYTKDSGRLHALRSVTKTLPKEMRPLMWKAYMEREAPLSLVEVV